MNLVVTWKLNFATCLSFCGNRSQLVKYYVLELMQQKTNNCVITNNWFATKVSMSFN